MFFSFKIKENGTFFAGMFNERFDPLFTVASFVENSRDVIPTEFFDNVHHGLGLQIVGWNDARKILETIFIT